MKVYCPSYSSHHIYILTVRRQIPVIRCLLKKKIEFTIQCSAVQYSTNWSSTTTTTIVITDTSRTSPPTTLSDNYQATTPDPRSVHARAPDVRFHRAGLPTAVSSSHDVVLLLPCMAQEEIQVLVVPPVPQLPLLMQFPKHTPILNRTQSHWRRSPSPTPHLHLHRHLHCPGWMMIGHHPNPNPNPMTTPNPIPTTPTRTIAKVMPFLPPSLLSTCPPHCHPPPCSRCTPS